MLAIRVNYAAAIVFVSLACAPASSSTRGAESTAATTPASNTVSPSPTTPPPKADADVSHADLARIDGNPASKLWVIVVSDFQCPYCKQWHDETYPAFRDEYVKTGKVRFAYINYPLNSHMNAWPAAQTAMCAAAQDKFWQMHDALFATQQQWETMTPPTPFLDSLAKSMNLDLKRFTDCVSSGKMTSLIQADHDRALAAGATSTPTFLVGTSLVVGAIPIADMRKAVDSALAKSGTPPR
jgi:protein-disulfide isomerase